MMSDVLKLLFLFLATVPSISRGINPCLYNREDVLPCRDHFSAGVAIPSANQYTVHATRLQRGPSGLPICVKRKEGEIVRVIEDLGTPQTKFLFSPGAEQSPEINYVNQIVAEYNVSCAKGTTAFIQFDALDIEPNNCFDGSQLKCRDYIEIDAGAGGTTEYCGNNLPSQPFVVGTGKFTLKLRTSFFTSFPGFRVFVTCFSGGIYIDPNTCTTTGGPLTAKRDTFELVDLAPAQVQQGLQIQQGLELSQVDRVSPRIRRPRPVPFTLTSADIRTLRSLSASLFDVALSQARRTIHASWPPPSFSRNDPNDVLDPAELNEPPPPRDPKPIPTLRPPSLPSVPPPKFLLPVEQPEPIPVFPQSEQLRQRRRRRAAISLGSPTLLSSKATMEAVRYENACNPIVQAVTSSYLTIAQRLAPTQLRTAQLEYQQEVQLRNDRNQGPALQSQ